MASSNLALPCELTLLLDARLKEILQQIGAPAVAVAVKVPGVGGWSSTHGLARVVPPEPASVSPLRGAWSCFLPYPNLRRGRHGTNG